MGAPAVLCYFVKHFVISRLKVDKVAVFNCWSSSAFGWQVNVFRSICCAPAAGYLSDLYASSINQSLTVESGLEDRQQSEHTFSFHRANMNKDFISKYLVSAV